MATGTQVGDMVSTEDLAVNDRVSVDHQAFVVTATQTLKDGTWLVSLEPAYGLPWDIEVDKQDQSEPMWERV